MKKVLEPLAHVPGVRRAILIAPDGVPIVSVTNHVTRKDDGEGASWHDSADDLNAFAGLAIGWMTEVERSVDPMSWSTPGRLVLRAARGTLVLLRGKRVLLSVELERGMAPEELRLPMEAALARLDRTLRRDTRDATQPSADPQEIPGIFPGPGSSSVEGSLTGIEGEPLTGGVIGLPESEAEQHTSVDTAAVLKQELRSPGPENENGPAAGAGRNDATGNEVP